MYWLPSYVIIYRSYTLFKKCAVFIGPPCSCGILHWTMFCRVYDRRSVTYSMWWRVWSRCPRNFVIASSSVCCRHCCSRRWWLSSMMCHCLWRTTNCCGGLPTTVLWSRKWLAVFLPSSHCTFKNRKRLFAHADVARTHDPGSQHPEMSNVLTRPKSLVHHKSLTLQLVEDIYAILYCW